MILKSPGAIFLKLGSVTVRWYGIMIAIGFLVATIFATEKAKRWQLDSEKLVNSALCAFLGGMIGARLYFVALNWTSYFASRPGEILAMWNGGMSIHGGLIGGVMAAVAYCILAKMPILSCLDLIACCTPVAQAIGRWGNFFNSEAFGRPAPDDFPVKLFIPFEHRPPDFIGFSYFHPTFLYESVWDLCLFLILYFFVCDRLKKYPGMTIMVYAAGYSIGRLLVEPLRTDSIMMGKMPVPIIASAATIVMAIICMLVLMRKYKTATPNS